MMAGDGQSHISTKSRGRAKFVALVLVAAIAAGGTVLIWQPRADQPDLRAAQVVSSGSGSTTGTAPFHKACGGRWRGVASLGCERGAAGQYQDGPWLL